jgi:amino acid permease
MAQSVIYLFIGMMWALILAGGGILVVLVSQITIQGYGEEHDFFIASVIKAVIAIVLVVLWVLVLIKLKNKIFQKQIKS